MAALPINPQRQAELLTLAGEAVARGELELGDRLCREMQAVGWLDERGWLLIAQIALKVHRPDVAKRAASNAGDSPQTRALSRAIAEIAPPPMAPQGAVHVIRAWGQGFWSDVDHVIGQLLVAEICGRSPIVLWGRTSRFGAGSGNAWDSFFEPVGDAAAAMGDFFPPKWNRENLSGDENGAFSGPWSRMAALPFFGRPEQATVSDFHAPPAGVLHWVRADSEFSGRPLGDVYAGLIARHVRVRAEIMEKAERMRQRLGIGDGSGVLAIHIRGSDKAVEMGDLRPVFAAYDAEIKEQLDTMGPGARILLLTDWEPAATEYRRRFGSRVLETGARRTAGKVGLHFLAERDGRQLGEQVLIDTLLAAGCGALVGMAYSNVSLFMSYFARLRGLAAQRISLVGPNLHENLNSFLLRRA
ncbi:MAG: O-fucosyltransferase family protein [Phycisphaerales bacterium]|nr:O-fucosyltransferase family protein [Planctomycetota bacterium]